MEEALFKLIGIIADRKAALGIVPTHALRSEIEQEVSKALNQLYTDGRIKVGKTLNSKWISHA